MVFHGTFPVFCFRVSSTPAFLSAPEDALRLSRTEPPTCVRKQRCATREKPVAFRRSSAGVTREPPAAYRAGSPEVSGRGHGLTRIEPWVRTGRQQPKEGSKQ